MVFTSLLVFQGLPEQSKYSHMKLNDFHLYKQLYHYLRENNSHFYKLYYVNFQRFSTPYPEVA